ncbi:hypothetical protein TARUN_9774 [Trichoderma arundinaceum]|uniref:Uncharacterized protein n=1 Tax=Trichoderma arundinaceum TaxID=490622 RepID=A0A395N8P3_TRIAR|nr:hypothetical protein TARUN_9774 [Trichoderma arundinaceum]
MPALPLLSRRLIDGLAKAPQLAALPTRASDGDAATLVARQQDSTTATFVVIPETYGSLHDSLSPGAIVGIVIAAVIGFILLLLVIYTILGFGPLSSLVHTTDITESKSYVSRSMLSSARPKSEKPKKKVPVMRGAAEILSIRRERTTRTSKRRSERRRKSPVIVEPMRKKREPSPLTTISSSSGAGPAPRDPLPSDYDEENEVVVIEETTPSSRRQSRKARPSRDAEGRTRRSSSRRSSYSEYDDRRYRR